MGKYMSDVNLATAVMNSGYQPCMVSADVKYGELTDFVRACKLAFQLGKGPNLSTLHQPIPPRKAGTGARMLCGKLIEPPTGYYVHWS